MNCTQLFLYKNIMAIERRLAQKLIHMSFKNLKTKPIKPSRKKNFIALKPLFYIKQVLFKVRKAAVTLSRLSSLLSMLSSASYILISTFSPLSVLSSLSIALSSKGILMLKSDGMAATNQILLSITLDLICFGKTPT